MDSSIEKAVFEEALPVFLFFNQVNVRFMDHIKPVDCVMEALNNLAPFDQDRFSEILEAKNILE